MGVDLSSSRPGKEKIATTSEQEEHYYTRHLENVGVSHIMHEILTVLRVTSGCTQLAQHLVPHGAGQICRVIDMFLSYLHGIYELGEMKLSLTWFIYVYLNQIEKEQNQEMVQENALIGEGEWYFFSLGDINFRNRSSLIELWVQDIGKRWARISPSSHPEGDKALG
ncbi:hypothetical protein Syun_001035 [Stephania yunnanensis]|uniref:Uncharacterized protein n=1 Tax=Stephania yunnanensis TaxID=152371 RepID=A0AAP0Q638_9MAGN